jgi:hypothetical protein
MKFSKLKLHISNFQSPAVETKLGIERDYFCGDFKSTYLWFSQVKQIKDDELLKMSTKLGKKKRERGLWKEQEYSGWTKNKSMWQGQRRYGQVSDLQQCEHKKNQSFCLVWLLQKDVRSRSMLKLFVLNEVLQFYLWRGRCSPEFICANSKSSMTATLGYICCCLISYNSQHR